MYIIAEGDLPICLCAHMDTVFPKIPNTFYFDREQSVLWSPQGLGADDRAGCYAIIELLEKGYKPSIILTDLEEKGGIGANTLVTQYPECPFSNCKALIQLDRCGDNDAVYYECDNKDFENLITSYGFETSWGTFSDISVLAPAWEIAAVNLSVGYLGEHTYTEILNIQHLQNTITKVERMLKDCKNWNSYSYIPVVYNGKYNYWNFYPDFINRCAICNRKIKDNETSHLCYATEDPDTDLKMCDECFNSYWNNMAEDEHPVED